MSIIWIVLILIVIGIALWLINAFIPMAAPIKIIINAVVVIAVVLWLLSVFGVINLHKGPHLGSLSSSNAALLGTLIKE